MDRGSVSVLLVEDDASIAIVITAALEAEGFDVTRCDSVVERDRLLALQPFAALVTDVMLTDGDGIESLAAVRALRHGMPVIILSAQNTLDTAVRASDTGALNISPSRSISTNSPAPSARPSALPGSPTRWTMMNRPRRDCPWSAAAHRCRRSTG